MTAALCAFAMALASPALRAAPQAGAVDPTFSASLGLAGKGDAVVAQPNGQLLLVGSFPRGIVRLNADGTVDAAFAPAVSVGGAIARAAVQPDGKVLVAGNFTAFDGVPRVGVARLNADGSLDPAFDPGAGNDFRGVSSALALQPDGKVILAGASYLFGGVTFAAGIVRLNPDGSRDSSFQPGAGANGAVNLLALQPDGRILAAGAFTVFNGAARAGLARLEPTGAVDTAFDPGTGAGGTVGARIAALLPVGGGRTLVGGLFTMFRGQAAPGLARLLPDGTLDAAFTGRLDGNGSAAPLAASLVAAGGGRVLVGGIFAGANGDARPNLCRLQAGGATDPSFVPEANTDLATGVRQLSLGADGLVTALTQSQVLLRLNADGSLDASFAPDPAPGPNARVRVVLPLADGRAFLGGEFTAFSGRRVSYLVRVNADGSRDGSFASTAPATVVSLALQPDGALLAGCLVNSGTGTRALVRLLADGSLDAGFVPPTSAYPAPIGQLALQGDGKVVAVGGPGSVPSIARINPDGTLDGSLAFGGAAFGGKTIAVQTDGRLVVGGSAGSFASGGPATPYSYARLDPSGGVEGSFFHPSAAAPGDETNAIAVLGSGRILLGQKSALGVQRLLPDGSLDLTFNTGNTSPVAVNALAVQRDGRVLAGGASAPASPPTAAFVQRRGANGSLDFTFAAAPIAAPGGASTSVLALAALPDGRVLVAGDFTLVGGQVRNYVARLNPDGSLDPSFVPGAGAPSVAALTLQTGDGNVVIGGNFRSAGGQPANALARLLPDGTLDPTFASPLRPGDAVSTLVQHPASLDVIAAGSFAAYASLPRPALRRVSAPDASSPVKPPIIRTNSIGGIDPSFHVTRANDDVSSLALQADGAILVAGQFTALDEAPRTYFGRLLAGQLTVPDGTVDPTFAPRIDAPVRVVRVQADGRILIGGEFGIVARTPRGRLARLLANGSLDTAFFVGAGADGPVTALRVQGDGRIVIGGSFTSVHGIARGGVARLNADGSLDLDFMPDAVTSAGGTPLVQSIDLQPDGRVVLGGLFDRVGSTARRNVARLIVTGALDTSFDQPAGGGPDGIVRALQLQPDGRTLLGGDFSIVDAAPRAGAARLLGDDSGVSPLMRWRQTYFNTPDNAGIAADTAMPFGDGVPNLLKYALNLDPLRADPTRMTPTGIKGLPLLGRNLNRQLTLTFVRRRAIGAPAITYRVEWSDGANAPYAENLSAIISELVQIDATWERVTYADSVSPPAAARRFVRLRVSDP